MSCLTGFLQAVAAAKFIITCVSTSEVVDTLVGQILPFLKAGTIIVDCTSGDPDMSLALSKKLQSAGVGFLDAPVSGGVTGAAKGTLTTMVGGSSSLLDEARPVLETFSSNVVHIGEIVGSGHALKGINNLMNVAHLLIAGEGLVALTKRGIHPDTALAAINGSSGRSLATTHRFPEHILTGKFAHGFTMDLMDKDARIGAAVLESTFPEASILKEAARVFHAAEEFVGPKSDYTESIKFLEHLGGAVLRNHEREST